MKEYLLTTDEFLKPQSVEGSDAYGILLTRLLILNPGTNPLHPGMGVGLGKYRFILDSEIPKLRSNIIDQIRTYLPPEFSSVVEVTLTLKRESKYLLIVIIANEVKYVFDTENSDTPIELSDLVY